MSSNLLCSSEESGANCASAVIDVVTSPMITGNRGILRRMQIEQHGWDQKFESISLQRGVRCEPGFGAILRNSLSRSGFALVTQGPRVSYGYGSCAFSISTRSTGSRQPIVISRAIRYPRSTPKPAKDPSNPICGGISIWLVGRRGAFNLSLSLPQVEIEGERCFALNALSSPHGDSALLAITDRR
jgi:hypothetical protein